MSNENLMEKLAGLDLSGILGGTPRCFEYLICIDFEATCWNENINVQRTEQKQEIIGKFNLVKNAFLFTNCEYRN